MFDEVSADICIQYMSKYHKSVKVSERCDGNILITQNLPSSAGSSTILAGTLAGTHALGNQAAEPILYCTVEVGSKQEQL